MSKGIRSAVNAKFVELLHIRQSEGNLFFRRAVMHFAMQQFDISVASAATHYNHAFKVAKAAAVPGIEGLGRAEDKKGGRPRKNVAAAPVVTLYTVRRVKDGQVIATGLSETAALMQCAKAVSQKKAKLEVVAE